MTPQAMASNIESYREIEPKTCFGYVTTRSQSEGAGFEFWKRDILFRVTTKSGLRSLDGLSAKSRVLVHKGLTGGQALADTLTGFKSLP